MPNIEEMLPPTPGQVIDTVLTLVTDVTDKAQEISRYDPVNVGAGLVGNAARKMKAGL